MKRLLFSKLLFVSLLSAVFIYACGTSEESVSVSEPDKEMKTTEIEKSDSLKGTGVDHGSPNQTELDSLKKAKTEQKKNSPN